jgi:N-acetylmuramoyl-L-alanine amidase
MMRLAVLATLLLSGAASSAPTQLQVSTARGVTRVALQQRAGEGPQLPLALFARAINGSVDGGEWVALVVGTDRYRFLVGTPLVHDGTELRLLPAISRRRGDTVFVPLAFVAEVMADPARRAWEWTPATATLAEIPPGTPIAARPARTTAGAADRARFPDGLRPGHHVTIDPGHGGTDPGNPGLFFPRGMREKDVNLAVSLKVRDELVRRGVRVTMTRTTDTLINLSHRAPRYCGGSCDLFVSVHVNALDPRAGYQNVRGFETYFLADAKTADAARVAKMENDAIRFDLPDEDAPTLTGLDYMLKDLQTNEFLRESARASELVQSHLREVHSGPDRGVKQAGFAVLSTARRPAILVELGYSTNRADANLMSSPDGQASLARKIADAIVAYLREFDRRTGDAERGAEP